MHPLLFQLGPIPIHTYGALIAIGFLIAVYTIKRLSEISKIDVDRTLDLVFWTLFVGFIGSRVLFIVTRWEDFAPDPMAMLRVWEGGLVFLGGPLAAMPFVVWYLRRHKMAAWRTMDSMIPGLVVAHSFGRLGCLMAGCCYGKPTGNGFGIKLHSELVDAPLRGINLHPTQLYESTALMILFFGLLWVHKRKQFDGQVLLTYFMAYPVIRSVVEIFRGDLIRGFVIEGVLSNGQFISLLIFIAATVALVMRLNYLKKGGSPVVGKKARA
jgi:phosphatidylglycerol:prolipoprotein diacylglycerol transferase